MSRRFGPIARFAIRFPSRTAWIDGRPVRVRLVRQFRQWYAVGPDRYGGELSGIGQTRDDAVADLAGCIRALHRSMEGSA